MLLKQTFSKKSSRTLILATCYSSIRSYFKIDFDLTMLFYVGSFNFRQLMFAFADLFPDILITSTKLHFQSWKKFFNDFAFYFSVK